MADSALVLVAERANARRSTLLVSTVLGKHVPVDPARCRLAGIALGLTVAGDARAPAARAALAGGPGAAGPLVDEVTRRPADAGEPVTVIAFAETATALGEQVAASLDAAWWQTTTRQPAPGRTLAFSEVHSHAPTQLLWMPEDGWPAGLLVIVDDELTTGRTAATLIGRLHAEQPRPRYVVAALVDNRPAERGPLEHAAHELDTQISVVALERRATALDRAAGWSGGRLPAPAPRAAPARVHELAAGYEGPAQHAGQDRAARRAVADAARDVAAPLRDCGPGTLVLGTGEHMALAQHAARCAGAALVSSSTRSPVLVCDRDGYPIRDGLSFVSPDDPALPGYAYNVRAAERPAVVVHFQDAAHRGRGQPMLDALAHAGARELVAVTMR